MLFWNNLNVSDRIFEFDSLGEFEPVERFQNWGDVLKFWGSGDGAGSGILDELESIDILGGGVEVE